MTGNTDMHLLVIDTFKEKGRAVATIYVMQHDTAPSHRVDQAVDCGLWNVVPLSGVKYLSQNMLNYYLSCFLGYLYFTLLFIILGNVYFYFTTFLKKIM